MGTDPAPLATWPTLRRVTMAVLVILTALLGEGCVSPVSVPPRTDRGRGDDSGEAASGPRTGDSGGTGRTDDGPAPDARAEDAGQAADGAGRDTGSTGRDADGGGAPPPPCVQTPRDRCGDHLVSGCEECDGPEDWACPGRCSRHCACPAAPPSRYLEVHVVDVGQGDSIVVVSPDGFVLLVDAGTETASETVLGRLRDLGIPGLDYTLVSHFHADHMGGMADVLDAFPEVVACFDNGGAESGSYGAAATFRRVPLRAGDTLDLGPSVEAEVLHAHQGSRNENDNSVVLLLRHGSRTLLLGGDCERSCEETLEPGPVAFYKVHHHGSATASTAAFLARITPEVSVISVGRDNAFGHPDGDTVARLATYGPVFRTDEDGDVDILSDGTRLQVRPERVRDDTR